MKLSEEHFRQRRRSFFQKSLVTAAVAITIVALASVFIFWVKAIAVEVRPEAAALKAQLSLSGWGWVQQDKVYLLSPEVDLEIAAQGFLSEVVRLERATLQRRITVNLKEAPAVIKATALPADAQIRWHIDKQLAGSGPKLQAAVEPGAHTLEVSHPYYQSQQSSMELERGTEKALSFKLEPVQGQLHLRSEPAGVPVLLDDQLIGNTPISTARRGGQYRLRIDTPDFETVSETIEITDKQPVVNRNYHLARRKASVDFRLSPAGGQLLINGKIVSATPQPLRLESLRELSISYSKLGYLSKTIKRTFAPNQTDSIALELQPEFGKVVIQTTPPSDIEINGNAMGQTPQTLTLRAIPQRIHLSKHGYRGIQKTVHPSSQRVLQIDEVLLTEQQAQLAESPATVKNSIGLELVLFKPRATSFELGAHRSEKGQRANEILRTVKLDRAFYVSRTEVAARHYHAFDPRVPASNTAVNNVAWGNAALFCNWLSAQEKLPHFYLASGNRITGYDPQSTGYRLLSEAEWEWLARYAKRSVPTKFIWGNKTTIPKNAANLADESAKQYVTKYIPNYNDGYPKLAPVGSFKRDPAGLYDLAGNVSEWVHDVYTVSKQDVLTDPLGISNNTSHSGHVVKGSSWKSGTLTELRSVYRQRALGAAADRGFRVARYIY